MNSTYQVRAYCRTFETLLPDLATQEKYIRDYCTFKRYNLVQLYTDLNVHGKNMIRPRLQKMLMDFLPGECLMIPSLNVFCENIRDVLSLFYDLNQKGVQIICLENNLDFTTPNGNVIFQAYMYLYTLEKNGTGQAISAQMQKKSSDGKLRTRPPFGFKFIAKDQDLAPEPEQQRIIGKIKEMYALDKNYSKIADKLNADGDNFFIYNNRKSVPASVPHFRAESIKRIIIDHGLSDTPHSRTPLSQRIKTPVQTINPTENGLPTVPTVSLSTATSSTVRPISIPIHDACSSEECQTESD